MTQNNNIPRRKNMRLHAFDYSQSGAYFVTICTHGRECVLAEVVNDKVVLSVAGNVAWECWGNLPNHYPHVELDKYVVMPNHIHGIITLKDTGQDIATCRTRAGYKPAPTSRHPLSEVIRGFKTFSGRQINRLRNSTGQSVWQRNFHDHVIRDEKTLAAVREYIINNPAKWSEDYYNPRNPT